MGPRQLPVLPPRARPEPGAFSSPQAVLGPRQGTMQPGSLTCGLLGYFPVLKQQAIGPLLGVPHPGRREWGWRRRCPSHGHFSGPQRQEDGFPGAGQGCSPKHKQSHENPAAINRTVEGF